MHYAGSRTPFESQQALSLLDIDLVKLVITIIWLEVPNIGRNIISYHTMYVGKKWNHFLPWSKIIFFLTTVRNGKSKKKKFIFYFLPTVRNGLIVVKLSTVEVSREFFKVHDKKSTFFIPTMVKIWSFPVERIKISLWGWLWFFFQWKVRWNVLMIGLMIFFYDKSSSLHLMKWSVIYATEHDDVL